MRDRRSLFLAVIFFLVSGLLPAVSTKAGTLVHAGSTAGPSAHMAAAENRVRHREEQRILAVLRARTPDPRVLGRMEEKLAELDPHRVRLASSLCDCIAAGEHSAGADIAFTLMAALIALS